MKGGIIMAQVNIRVTDELKESSSQVLDELGLEMTSAVKMFLQQIVIQRRIPFDVVADKKPDIVLALEEVKKGNLKEYNSVEELMIGLNNED